MTLRKPLAFNYTEGIEQEIDPVADSFAIGQIILNGIGGIGLNANGQSVTGLPTPVNASDATPKSYVDNAIQGINAKPTCIAIATTNISSLSGTQTIDGVSVTAGQRVLLTGQTNAVQNGIWVVNSGAWTRPPDFGAGAHAAAAYVFVEEGTLNADNGYLCITDPPNDVVDTNSIAFVQFSGAGQIIAGPGIGKSGNQLSVVLAANPGLQFTGGALDHLLAPGGGLSKTGAGLQALLNSNATLASDSNGLRTLGLPSLFTINGVATSSNVTSVNLGTLTAGSTSQADALHTHQMTQGSATVVGFHTNGAVALAAGDPVGWSSTASVLVRGDAGVTANARIIGIALQATAPNGTAQIIKKGIAQGVLSNAVAGTPYFLNVGGGLTTQVTTTSSARIVRVGFAVSATDIEVLIDDLGQRSAN
jgi:hypothetical protein